MVAAAFRRLACWTRVWASGRSVRLALVLGRPRLRSASALQLAIRRACGRRLASRRLAGPLWALLRRGGGRVLTAVGARESQDKEEEEAVEEREGEEEG